MYHILGLNLLEQNVIMKMGRWGDLPQLKEVMPSPDMGLEKHNVMAPSLSVDQLFR